MELANGFENRPNLSVLLEIDAQSLASTPRNLVRYAGLPVARITVSPAAPMRVACAARIASASRLWSAAVGSPRRRISAHSSAALRITGVVIRS